MAIQAVCVLIIWRITDFIAKKMYPVPEEEISEEENSEADAEERTDQTKK